MSAGGWESLGYTRLRRFTEIQCRLIAKIAAHMELTPEQQCVLIEHLKKADLYGFDGDKFYDWIRQDETAIEEGNRTWGEEE
mgnify:CR=1 FL=1